MRVGFEAGGNFMQKHWKPKKHVQDEIDFYVENYFKGHYAIGIQKRFELLGYVFRANYSHKMIVVDGTRDHIAETTYDLKKAVFRGRRFSTTSC